MNNKDEYMNMAYYIMGQLGFSEASRSWIKGLEKNDIESIAADVYLKCKDKHDGRAFTWPKYLYRSMRNAFIREANRVKKAGIRFAPAYVVGESLKSVVDGEPGLGKSEPYTIPDVETKILAEQIQAKIKRILSPQLAEIYLGKVMYDSSFREMAATMNTSHETVRKRFNEAEALISKAKVEGMFK